MNINGKELEDWEYSELLNLRGSILKGNSISISDSQLVEAVHEIDNELKKRDRAAPWRSTPGGEYKGGLKTKTYKMKLLGRIIAYTVLLIVIAVVGSACYFIWEGYASTI